MAQHTPLSTVPIIVGLPIIASLHNRGLLNSDIGAMYFLTIYRRILCVLLYNNLQTYRSIICSCEIETKNINSYFYKHVIPSLIVLKFNTRLLIEKPSLEVAPTTWRLVLIYSFQFTSALSPLCRFRISQFTLSLSAEKERFPPLTLNFDL